MEISEQTAKLVESTAAAIVDSAIQIHIELGPGLLERVYEGALCQDLKKRGIQIARQRAISFTFRDIRYEDGFRIDLLANECVVVEIKSIETLLPVHTKQVLTYLRLSNTPLGLLINFGGKTLKSGLKRVMNGYWSSPYSCLRANHGSVVDTGESK